MAQYTKLRMLTRTSRGFSPSRACALAKSPVRATALGSPGQSVKPAVIQATLYIPLFFILATLSFAIPPPISASVRSRQAGTETEREASAMEALGPGKNFVLKKTKREIQRGAQTRRPTRGRGSKRGLDEEKQTEAQPEFPVLYVNVALLTARGARSLRGRLRCVYRRDQHVRGGFIYPRHALPVVCVSALARSLARCLAGIV